MTQSFSPKHINATRADLAGNGDIGRYILLPGSDGRAHEIAKHFDQLTIKQHARGSHLYTGTIKSGTNAIDVATIATGMGCPSMEIILHELFQLGGKRFLRVGTAGSLQPTFIKVGDIINVQASVRDESTTADYVPIAVPAVASVEFTAAILAAANALHLIQHVYTGTVHCKSSFYAREFGAGPQAHENKHYNELMSRCGVLASEMETAALFIQSQLYNYQLMQEGMGPAHHVLSGAILGIISVPSAAFASEKEARNITDDIIALSLETIRTIAQSEIKID